MPVTVHRETAVIAIALTLSQLQSTLERDSEGREAKAYREEFQILL